MNANAQTSYPVFAPSKWVDTVAAVVVFVLLLLAALVMGAYQQEPAEVIHPTLQPLVCEHARMVGGWKCGEV
jgi:hypothetical protein